MELSCLADEQNHQGLLAAFNMPRNNIKTYVSAVTAKMSLHQANTTSGVNPATQGPPQFPFSLLLPVRGDGD